MIRLRIALLIGCLIPLKAGAQHLRVTIADRQSGAPIADAVVMVVDRAGNTIATTASDSAGQFQFSTSASAAGRATVPSAVLPSGAHNVVVRRLGYREARTWVTIPEQGTAEQEILLSAVTTLDTVTVRASAGLMSFEEHRALGIGRFLTRAELEPMEGRKMAEILEQVGARVMRSGHRAWVTGAGRGPTSIMNRLGKCAELEGAAGSNGSVSAGCNCFAQVYLNDNLLYRGSAHKGELVPDINAILPSSLEAIEFYKGPVQTPLKYSRLNSECGVLVLHTRRTPGSTRP
jgi:hypothetical protein